MCLAKLFSISGWKPLQRCCLSTRQVAKGKASFLQIQGWGAWAWGWQVEHLTACSPVPAAVGATVPLGGSASCGQGNLDEIRNAGLTAHEPTVTRLRAAGVCHGDLFGCRRSSWERNRGVGTLFSLLSREATVAHAC